MNAFVLFTQIASLVSTWGGIPEPSLLYVRSRAYRPVAIELARGRDQQALAALEAFLAAPDGPLGLEEVEGLRFLRARLLVDAGRIDEGRVALASVADRNGLFADAARYRLALLAEEAGATEEALAGYTRVLPWSLVADDAARRALKLLLDLGQIERGRVLYERLLTGSADGRFDAPEVPPEWRAEADLRTGGGLARRVDELRKEVKRKGPGGALASWRARNGSGPLGRLGEAVVRCEPASPETSSERFAAVVGASRDAALVGVAYAEWVRCASEYVDPTEATARYAAGTDALATAGLLADAGRRTVKALLAAGELPASIRIATHLAEVARTDPETTRTFFAIGLAALEQGDTLDARTAFEFVAASQPLRLTDGAVTWEEKSLYWLGRVDLAEQRRADALERYRTLASRYPISYYTLLAASRFHELSDEPLRPLEVPRPAGPLPDYLIYQDLGLNREAHAAMQARLREREVLPTADLALYLWLDPIVEQRTPDRVFKNWRGQVPLGAAGVPDEVRRVLYDLPFGDEIVAAARSVQLSPWLLASVVRKESGFDETIRSEAGAVGLCQLMPRVARYVLAKHPLPFSPGAVYLKSLLHAFRSAPLAVLAYNVGPGRVSQYLKQHERVNEVDLLLEHIPSRGGRDFAVKVLTGWAAYALLAGERLPRIDTAIHVRPDEVPIIQGEEHAGAPEGIPGFLDPS
jgi:soluble lytic murein transglycosylase-like protein